MNLPIIYLLIFVLGACAGDNSTTAETNAEPTTETIAPTTTEGKILTLMGWEKYDHCT